MDQWIWGSKLGPKKQPKNKSNFKTLSDTILGTNFGKIIEKHLVFDGFLMGLQEHIWAADPILRSILEPFWGPFLGPIWAQKAAQKQEPI